MTTTEWKASLAKIPKDDWANVEERAAIHEYDGRLDRDAAERRALKEYWQEQGIKLTVNPLNPTSS